MVPPKTGIAIEKCRSRVVLVETPYSFPKRRVGSAIFGINTPMEIKVACASSAEAELPLAPVDICIGSTATPAEIQDALKRAADMAVGEDRPVLAEY